MRLVQKLSSEDLKNISKKPLEGELSLKILSDFYLEHLVGKYFVYDLEFESDNEIITRKVKLLFEPSNLCHLLGFQHIFEGRAESKTYEGQTGFDLLQSEELTLETLKADKVLLGRYKAYRERILYFAFIYQLVQNPTAVYFNKDIVKSDNVKLESDFILYNKHLNRYLHLGIDFQPSTPVYYFPRTFFVRKNDDYLNNQISAKVAAFSIEEL